MVPWKENDMPGEKEHRKENVLNDITDNEMKLNLQAIKNHGSGDLPDLEHWP